MDEKIFIKETQEKSSNKQLIIIVAALLLIIVGVVGIVSLIVKNDNTTKSNSNNSQNTAQQPPTTNTPTNNPDSNTDTKNNGEDTPVVPPVAVPPITPPPVNPPAAQPVYKAPQDSSKMNLYFPKSPETKNNSEFYVATLRDKPTSNAEGFAISQIVTGPSAEEKSKGFYKTWSIGGSSKCDKNIGYKYNISGSTLRIDLCKDFTGSSTTEFLKSLDLSIKELGRVKKVAVITNTGSCLGKPAGDKSCL